MTFQSQIHRQFSSRLLSYRLIPLLFTQCISTYPQPLWPCSGCKPKPSPPTIPYSILPCQNLNMFPLIQLTSCVLRGVFLLLLFAEMHRRYIHICLPRRSCIFESQLTEFKLITHRMEQQPQCATQSVFIALYSSGILIEILVFSLLAAAQRLELQIVGLAVSISALCIKSHSERGLKYPLCLEISK